MSILNRLLIALWTLLTITGAAIANPTFERTPADPSNPAFVYKVELSHDDIKEGRKSLESLPDVKIITVLKAIWNVIETVDLVGGNQGVEISGVSLHATVIVTPKGKGAYGEVLKYAKEADKIGKHWGGILEGTIKTAGTLFSDVKELKRIADQRPLDLRTKHPYGYLSVVKKVDDQTQEHFESDTDKHITLVPVGNGKVALLTKTGYVAAEKGGNDVAIADRGTVGSCEEWELIKNSDASYSFKSEKGYFLTTDSNNTKIHARSNVIGVPEKWTLKFIGRGKVLLIQQHSKLTFQTSKGRQ